MKKKMVVLIAALLSLVLICGCALAESWTCPSCSQINDGNFCSNCGAKKPDSSSSSNSGKISNLRVKGLNNGNVEVTWEAPFGSGPYRVKYKHAGWIVQYYEESSYSTTSATLRDLIPGATYTITVSDGSSSQSKEFTAPIYTFTEFSNKSRYLKMVNTTAFSLSELERDPTAMFELRLGYPGLARDRQYVGRLALKTPLGYVGQVDRWDPITLEKQYSYYYWNIPINDWLSIVKEDFGTIPIGEYSYEWFMDDKVYAYATFRVNQ